MLPELALTRTQLFRGIGTPAARLLAARATERRYGRGEVLFPAGAPARGLFVIQDGEVKVVRGRGGRQHVVHVEGPGGTLGEVPLLLGGGYPATAIATRATICQVFTREGLEAAIRADPEVAFAILRGLAGRVRGLVERLDGLATRSVTTRLAGLLVRQHRTSPGMPFGLGATQQTVAEELGTVREVVVRALGELRRQGVLVSAGRGRYLAPDPGRLEALAER